MVFGFSQLCAHSVDCAANSYTLYFILYTITTILSGNPFITLFIFYYYFIVH